MIKTEIAPGIVVYKDVLDGYESIIGDIEDATTLNGVSWVPASVKAGDENGVDTTKRDTMTISIAYKFFEDAQAEDSVVGSFNAILSKIFYDAFTRYEEDYKGSYGIATDWHDQYAILKYGVGQKFTNHIDDHRDYHRRISTLYYLNDNYTGGEINFPRFNISYKPNANELILFPSTYVYNHSVSEVTEGTRYAVVSWMR